MVVSCTGGERGDIQNPALEASAMADRDMGGLRRIEMEHARGILGVEHRWLGYHDSGLPEEGETVPALAFALIPLEISAEPLVRIIREFRPQVVHTYDETGGYPHPDHIRTHEIAMFAIEAAADADRYPEAGEAWTVSKVYFDRIFSSARVKAMHARLLELEPESERTTALAEMIEWMGERGAGATTRIDVGDWLDERDAALRAHASQVAGDSAFFFWPNELQREIWPWEDFQRERSLVESPLPETDLFAGLAGDAADAGAGS
jgi:mycothiol S-conjugate amidase